MTEQRAPLESEEKIHLKDRELSAFLAWLIPGLGHLYQGRRAKAALFFVCILGLFVYGLYLSGSSKVGWGRAVYFAGQDNWYYAGQVGVGLAALPALVQASRVSGDKPVICGGFMAPPRPSPPGTNGNQPTKSEIIKQLSPYYDLGVVYTMIAGLLNVLAIYDAWGGPVFPPPAKREEDADEASPEESQGEGR